MHLGRSQKWFAFMLPELSSPSILCKLSLDKTGSHHGSTCITPIL